jgi:hypothetical protein
LPLKGSGEQGGKQLDRLRFLSSGRLDHRAEPDLPSSIVLRRNGTTLPPQSSAS